MGEIGYLIKLLLFLLLSTIIGSTLATCDSYPGVYEKVSKLSPHEIVNLLNSLDNSDTDNFLSLSSIDIKEIKTENWPQVRCGIHKALIFHYEHKSWLMKMASLLTFYNIVTV